MCVRARPRASTTDLEKFDLSHEPSRVDIKDKAAITAIRWSPDGIHLATGSYDGQTRTWTPEGELEHTMHFHCGPVLSLKWNSSVSVLLVLSCDGKMIAWDVASGDVPHRVFEIEEAVATDQAREEASKDQEVDENQTGGKQGIEDETLITRWSGFRIHNFWLVGLKAVYICLTLPGRRHYMRSRSTRER